MTTYRAGRNEKNTNKNALLHVEKQKHSPQQKKIYKGWKLKMEGIL